MYDALGDMIDLENPVADDSLNDGLFKPWAEEFACRARALQARGLPDGAALSPGRGLPVR